MLLKVCGMRENENIAALRDLQPDFMGLIFYPPSSRFAAETADPTLIRSLQTIRTVGVFVNANEHYMVKMVEKFALNLVQLHGTESPGICAFIRSLGVGVIKVFSVGNDFDFGQLAAYEPYVDYFLFDTQGKLPGGNGVAFNWEILQQYPSRKPFFLSGGIGLEELAHLKQLDLPQMVAVDVNSRFEIRPGLKDMEKLKQFQSLL